jgi:hypothetical protein
VSSLALTACGSSGSSITAARSSAGSSVRFVALNTQKVERAITQSSWAQRGVHVRVSCPSRVQQQKGLVFYCTAVYGASRTPFMVTEVDGASDVHYVAR